MRINIVFTCLDCGATFGIPHDRIDGEFRTEYVPIDDEPKCTECGCTNVDECDRTPKGWREKFYADL